MILELVLASLFALLGVRSAVASLRQSEPEDSPSTRLLLALHSAAGAAAWFALASFFLVSGLTNDPSQFQWLGVVAIGMAGLRMVAAGQLARR